MGWRLLRLSAKILALLRVSVNFNQLRLTSNKSRFNSYSVRNSVLIISHITFRDCRVHIFSDDLSRLSVYTQHTSTYYCKKSEKVGWRLQSTK